MQTLEQLIEELETEIEIADDHDWCYKNLTKATEWLASVKVMRAANKISELDDWLEDKEAWLIDVLADVEAAFEKYMVVDESEIAHVEWLRSLHKTGRI